MFIYWKISPWILFWMSFKWPLKLPCSGVKGGKICISLLAQHPVLFRGSVRKNLDLMEQFKDADLWRALEDVQLKEIIQSLEGQLDYELLEQGANVSVGERQLICLARVLLQRNKIITLDEPTAHVDPDTERTIRNVVHKKLQDSTVITIAHRLHTIRDCDKILDWTNGEVFRKKLLFVFSLTKKVFLQNAGKFQVYDGTGSKETQ